jgi:hypothetical protein
VVQKRAPTLSPQQCQQVIDTWLRTGVLHEAIYYDTGLRKKRLGLFVNNGKRPGPAT